MKKLLTLAVLALSPLAFAQDASLTTPEVSLTGSASAVKNFKIDVITKNDQGKIINKESFKTTLDSIQPAVMSSTKETAYIKEVSVDQKTGEKKLILGSVVSGTTIVLHKISNNNKFDSYKIVFETVNLLEIKKFQEVDLVSTSDFKVSNDFYLEKNKNVTMKLTKNTELLISLL